MDYILETKNISKSFPGVKALDDVSIKIQKGSIHAIVGENGAGKSTFIKILSGVYQADSGAVFLKGEQCNFKTPFEAQNGGISVVHQELKLVDTLTVKENIWLGRPPTGKFGVSAALMHKKAKEILDYIQINLDPDELVMKLSVGQQQIVEICKALSYNSDVIIMDEPSATLTDSELKVLFRILKDLKSQGITIIYITHRLEEVFYLSDHVSVLRDGTHIETTETNTVTKDQLISKMVGRELGMEYPKEKNPIGETILSIKDLTQEPYFRNISFELKKGEILGFAGLVGSGRTEVARAIMGANTRGLSGEIELNGKAYQPENVKKAITYGLGLVPEDRKKQGLVQEMTIAHNTSMANLNSILSKGVISFRKEKTLAESYKNKLKIATPDTDKKVINLSGGNQQKVVLAKWMNADTEILIIDEPTRGIDVGAKQEIYILLQELIKAGKSIIMISSDMPELIGMCDRLIVMHEGKKTGEIYREDFTQEKIMTLALA